MIDVRINNQSLRPILAGPPVITDQLGAVCRTLEISVQQAAGLINYLGQPIELWYGGKRWFFGFLMKRGYKSDGSISYLAYDPLYFMSKNPDDWYFKNITATQGFKILAGRSGVKVYSLANTGAVFAALYYQGAEADKVATDLVARTYKANGVKYWYRYRPDDGSDGIHLFKNVLPAKIWAFQVGINLESAEYEESIEDTCTIVRLVNRETGKTVTKIDSVGANWWGPMVHFEEIDKDGAATMEQTAQRLLKELSKINTTMRATGINPNRVMPQFFTGDVIYVEEKYTGLIGAYHIRNIVQTFQSDNLVTLGFDIQEAADIPAIQYEDATKNPAADKTTVKTTTTTATKKTTVVAKPKTKAGAGVQQAYSAEVKKAIDTYGL